MLLVNYSLYCCITGNWRVNESALFTKKALLEFSKITTDLHSRTYFNLIFLTVRLAFIKPALISTREFLFDLPPFSAVLLWRKVIIGFAFPVMLENQYFLLTKFLLDFFFTRPILFNDFFHHIFTPIFPEWNLRIFICSFLSKTHASN